MKPLLPYYHQNSGSLFIVTLVVTLGLVSLAIVFGHSMIMAYRASDNELAGRQAEQAIEGAARYAEYLMNQAEQPGLLPELSSYQCEALPVGEARYWYIGVPQSADSGLGGGMTQPVLNLVDESSKLNLNYADVGMLQMLPGMTPELAASIVAWRQGSAPAAASTSSVSLSTAPVKHAPFESVWELALLTGTGSGLLYGQDQNFNHVLETEEATHAATNSRSLTNITLPHGLLEYVTVFSREPNVLASGTRLNVTTFTFSPATQPPQLLVNALSSQGRAKAILSLVYGSVAPKSVLEFFVRCSNLSPSLTQDEVEKLTPLLTGTNGKYAPGLVNVNTASATVLACIPGIGNKADQLVAERAKQSSTPTNFWWLMNSKILTDSEVQQAGPKLTARSYQMTADIAAVGRHGRGYRRTQFVIDSSSGTARIIYRRNLSSLGWALGSETRQSLLTQ